jgi:DNA modification methylase
MNRILTGDATQVLKTLPAGIVQTGVTSPPYFGLRDYGVAGQLGLEETPEEYVTNMIKVLRDAHRVLRDDGTVWLNLGDSYAGSGKGAYSDGFVRLTKRSEKQ